MELVAEGRTNAEIADSLGLSLDGAKWHVREILAKFEFESREEAADWWRQHNRIAARATRAFSGLGGLGLWKTAAVAAGLSAACIVGVAFAMTFRGSLPGQGDDAVARCVAENMRMETTETLGDTTGIELRIGLREPDWYEGILRAVQISDRKVESPCLLATDASIEIIELGPLGGSQPKNGSGPIAPASPIEAVGNRAIVELDATLRRGAEILVLTAELSNWCDSERAVGLNIAIPARRTGGPPTTRQVLPVRVSSLPPCLDPASPPRLTVAPAQP